MILRKITIIISTILLSQFSLLAQNNELSLQESLNIGLSNSSEIKIAKSQLKIANAQITKTTSLLLPKLTLEGAYNHIDIIDPAIFSLGPLLRIPLENPINTLGGSISIQQPIFTGLRTWSLKKAAEFSKKASIEELNLQKNSKALEIQIAYWNLYKSQKIRVLVDNNLTALGNHLSQTEHFLKNGLATENDVLKLKVELQSLKLSLVNADNTLSITRAAFNKSIGYDLNALTNIQPVQFDINGNNYNYDELLGEAHTSRKELQILNYQKKASEKNITAARSHWFPQIYASGNYYNYRVSSDNFQNGSQVLKLWTAGIGLSWDIWNWGKSSAETEIAKEQKFQIEKNYSLLKHNIEIEVYKNYLELISEKKKISISELAVKSAKLNYEIMKSKYSSQIVNTTDLIDAETKLLNAQINLATSKAEFKIAEAKLKFSAGKRLY